MSNSSSPESQALTSGGADSSGDCRPTLTFCLLGVPLREDAVFRSMLRLLSHRTLQRWSYQADTADLTVLGPDAQRQSAAPMRCTGPHILLGAGSSAEGNHLPLPLQVMQLQHLLDRLGTQVLQMREREQTQSQSSQSQVYLLRLLRWPTGDVMALPGALRMATLLTGKPLSREQLQARSGLAMSQCSAFLLGLQAAGLLIHVPVEQAAAGKPGHEKPMQSSLLARIRSRLKSLA